MIGIVLSCALAACGTSKTTTRPLPPSRPSVPTSRGATEFGTGSGEQPDSAILADNGSVVWVRTQQNELYRSTDGGSTFSQVTPPSWPTVGAALCGIGAPPEATSSMMWIAQSTCGGQVYVAHTDDSGNTWTKSTLPTRYDPQAFPSASASFVNNNDGWTSVITGHVGVSEVTDLFRSVDGGQHWTLETSVPEMGPAQFITSSLGFAGSANEQNAINRTTDGGGSWQPVELPLPSGFSAFQASLQGTPQFTSPEDGVLAVSFAPMTAGPARMFADITTDGGSTWRQQSLPVGAYALSVVDTTNWVIIGGGIAGPDFVAHSADAGRSWSAVTPNRAITGIENLQFISPAVGIGVVSGQNCPSSSAPPPPPCSPQSAVLKTTDGGADWTSILLPGTAS